MIRAGLILLVLALIGAAAAWFAEYPGNVSVNWSGWRIDTSVSAAALSLGLVVVASALTYRMWAWLRGGPRRLAASREIVRRQRGYKALTQGMVAVAAGDGAEAMRLSKSAEALLKDPPLTLLLSAQSAQLDGDEGAAERYFTSMLANPDLEFLGLRGLLSQSLRRGDNDAALKFARRAYALKPRAEWAQTTLFELQMAGGQWKRAEALLHDMGRKSSLSPGQVDKRRAILLYEQALSAKSAGDGRKAQRLAVKAHEAAPGFVPGAVLAAQGLAAAGKQRKASAILHAAWNVAPHPDLVEAFRALWPGEDAEKRLERFTQMVGDGAANPQDPRYHESNFGLARFAVDARDWAAARAHLQTITGDHPSGRVCRLWAELEDAENGPSLAARDWLMKASSASNDPAWVCAECAQAAPQWSASCPNCQMFDQMEWRATGGGTTLLALPGLEPAGGRALKGGSEDSAAAHSPQSSHAPQASDPEEVSLPIGPPDVPAEDPSGTKGSNY